MVSFRKFLLPLILSILPLSFISCSSDDDDDNKGSGNISVTFGNEKMPLKYVFWYFDENTYGGSTDKKNLIIEFYSYDPTKVSAANFPKTINYLSIDFDVPLTQTGISPITVSSEDYNVYVAQNVTLSSEGWQGETGWRDSNNSPLIITREGDKYSITIAHADITDDDDNLKVLNLSFVGPINYLPEEFQDL